MFYNKHKINKCGKNVHIVVDATIIKNKFLFEVIIVTKLQKFQ